MTVERVHLVIPIIVGLVVDKLPMSGPIVFINQAHRSLPVGRKPPLSPVLKCDGDDMADLRKIDDIERGDIVMERQRGEDLSRDFGLDRLSGINNLAEDNALRMLTRTELCAAYSSLIRSKSSSTPGRMQILPSVRESSQSICSQYESRDFILPPG